MQTIEDRPLKRRQALTISDLVNRVEPVPVKIPHIGLPLPFNNAA